MTADYYCKTKPNHLYLVRLFLPSCTIQKSLGSEAPVADGKTEVDYFLKIASQNTTSFGFARHEEDCLYTEACHYTSNIKAILERH